MSRSTSNNNINQDIALGKIQGTVEFDKFGYNNAISILTTPEDVWNGLGIYTGFPIGVAETMEIFSSNINDTGAGTGARTVTISGLLDINYNQMPDITVTLNGVTPVSLGAQTYLRASRMKIGTVGATGNNLGNITLRHTTTIANIFAFMPIGLNQTSIMAFTVPAGKIILIDRIHISLGRLNGNNGSANISIRNRLFGVDKPFHSIRNIGATTAHGYSFTNNGYLVFREKEDIKVTVDNVSDNNSFVNGEMDGIMIDI